VIKDISPAGIGPVRRSPNSFEGQDVARVSDNIKAGDGNGIDSISLNPDSFVSTTKFVTATEQRIGRAAK
jgi:hypothetical protein